MSIIISLARLHLTRSTVIPFIAAFDRIYFVTCNLLGTKNNIMCTCIRVYIYKPVKITGSNIFISQIWKLRRCFYQINVLSNATKPVVSIFTKYYESLFLLAIVEL